MLINEMKKTSGNIARNIVYIQEMKKVRFSDSSSKILA